MPLLNYTYFFLKSMLKKEYFVKNTISVWSNIHKIWGKNLHYLKNYRKLSKHKLFSN